MNYQKIYNQICQKAKNETDQRRQRKADGEYFEGHHIVPKCFKGEGKSHDWNHINIVPLTAREHFICHWLLHKIYPDNLSLQVSFEMMCFVKNDKQYRYVPSSHVIQEAKKSIIERNKRIGLLKVGKHYPKLSESKRGFKFTEESKKRMSQAQINMSPEKRLNISISQKNKFWITDGFKSKRHNKDLPIPEGFWKGRIIRNKNN